MIRTLLAAFFLLAVSVPANAKSADTYPVSCNDVWAAVKEALNNPRDYGIVSMNDDQQRAAFVIVGALTVFTDRVALTATDGGCAMKTTILDIGPDNHDWRQFHKRVGKALTRQQAAKPAASPKSPGQM